jgi:hypothetical protein
VKFFDTVRCVLDVLRDDGGQCIIRHRIADINQLAALANNNLLWKSVFLTKRSTFPTELIESLKFVDILALYEVNWVGRLACFDETLKPRKLL